MAPVFDTIRSKFILWYLLIGILPVLCGSLIFYRQQIRSLKEEKAEHLVSVRNLKVNELEHWFQERTGDMRVMSGDFELRGLEGMLAGMSHTNNELEAIGVARELLMRNKRNYRAYNDLMIIHPETRKVLVSTNPDALGTHYPLMSHGPDTLMQGEVFIEDIHISDYLQEPVMTLYAPIICLAHKTHVIGILVAQVDLENSLYPILLNRVGLGSTGETLIVREDMLALNELRWFENAPLRLRIKAEPARLAVGGATGIIVADDYRGEHVLAAFTHIPRTGWGFVSKQDISEFYQPVYSFAKKTLVIFSVSLVLIVLLGLYLSDSVTRPLLSLTRFARSMTDSETGMRAPVEGSSETRELATALNHMTGSLARRVQIKSEAARISRVIMNSGESTKEIVQALLHTLREILDCHVLVYYARDTDRQGFRILAEVGAAPSLTGKMQGSNPPGEVGLALSSRRIEYIRKPGNETPFRFVATSGEFVPAEIISVPVLDGEVPTGIISMAHLTGFPPHTMELLEEVWPVLNAAYNRMVVTEELKETAHKLKELNQKLEEQSEELQQQTQELVEQSKELYRQNMELEVKSGEVEEANRLKSEFLSNVSHELRTPLNSILSLSRVLAKTARKNLGKKERSYLEIIERNGRNLLHLINDILDISKIEAGKLEIRPGPVDLKDIVRNVVESQRQFAVEKGLTIRQELRGNLPHLVSDGDRLSQILSNLVNNAIKFTRKGEVVVEATASESHFRIEVRDTGIGISEENMSRIFDQFTQLDGNTSREYEGTGLGLAIVKELTGLLGGRIELESEPGRGSVFTLLLPITLADNSVAGNSESDGGINGNFDAAGKTILLVEDNEVAVMQIKSVLEDEGYFVRVAMNGTEAMARLYQQIPEAIILDLMMPDIDGFELLNQIRSEKPFEKIPVMILTAKDLETEDMDRLTANHVRQFVQKGDINLHKLLQKIRELINSSGEDESS